MKKILLTCIAVACSLVAVAEELLIEAESFSQRGGWVLDQQFMDQMGSPYLMAHGMPPDSGIQNSLSSVMPIPFRTGYRLPLLSFSTLPVAIFIQYLGR